MGAVCLWLACFYEPIALCGACLRHGTKGGPTNGAAPPLRLPPFEIPLLEPLLCGREVHMLRVDVYEPGRTNMQAVGLYENPCFYTNLRFLSPKQMSILSFVSHQDFPAQRKGGGISTRGEPWFTPLAPCRRHALQRLSVEINKQDTQKTA